MELTLDEAIQYCEEVTEGQYNLYDCYLQRGEQGDYVRNCLKCAEERRQFAEWLKDYKRLLELELSYNSIKTELKTEPCKGNVYLTREAYEELCYKASKWDELDVRGNTVTVWKKKE